MTKRSLTLNLLTLSLIFAAGFVVAFTATKMVQQKSVEPLAARCDMTDRTESFVEPSATVGDVD